MINNRAQKVSEFIEKHGLDAMLFTDMYNIRYLTGFTGTDGAVVLTADTICFFTDSRYLTQAAAQVDCDVLEYNQKISGIVDYINTQIVKGSIGFESQNITVAFHKELEFGCADLIKLVPMTDISAIRAIKDEDELRKIEDSALISLKSLESIINEIRPGVTETKIALALEIATRKNGSEVKAFDFIVASGTRGALPHGVASAKIVEDGDTVTIDFGSCFKGYYSDETVNFAIGDIIPEMQAIHDIVLKAHDLAIAAVKPGTPLKEIDRVARDYIGKNGYGACFGHGLGHGVGLEVHEYPRVSPQSEVSAEPGMVFTIEPGIYKPGLGGVRIEDIVVVTEIGCRCLTSLPKELRVLSS